MKKIITILTVSLFAVTLIGCKGGTVPETTSSAYFTDVIMPFVIQWGTTAIGVLTVLIPLLSKINSSRKTFDSASGALKTALEENKRLREEMSELKAKTDTDLTEMRTSLVSDVKQLSGEVHKLLEVEKRAYLNSPALVSDGTAKKIAEVLNETTDKA